MSYVLFFLAGLGFGYAAVGKWKFTPLGFPTLLAAGAAVRDGISGGFLLKFIVAIALTLIGIALGMFLDARGSQGQAAGAG